MDFMETGKLPTDQVQFFVLDEAGERRGWVELGFVLSAALAQRALPTPAA